MATGYIHILATCIALLTPLPGTSADCPEQCKCEMINATSAEVGCIYSNGKILTDFPLTLPSTIIHLEISGHNISTIHNIPYPNLTSLRLQNNRIRIIQPGAFQNLKHLRHLILSSNQLEAINSELFNDLEALQFLILDNNNISKFMKRSFDGKFMKSIRKIDLANNSIVSTDDVFVDLNIEELDFTGNRIVTIPKITGMHVESLILDHNRIEQVLEQDMKLYPNLNHLSLHNNGLKNISSKAFIWNSLLESLNLEHNNITHIHPGTFTNQSAIRSIRLSWNKLEMLDKEVIPWNEYLQDLRLYGNPWNCVCSMSWLYNTSRNSVIYRSNSGSDNYSCASPNVLKNKHIYLVKASDFQCSTTMAHARLVMVLGLISSVALILLIGWFIYTVRRRRQHAQYFRPSASSVYKKVTEPTFVVESTSLAFSEDDSRKLVYSDGNDRVHIV